MPAMIWIGGVILLLLAAAVAILWIAPPVVERDHNRVVSKSPYHIPAETMSRHERLAVVDLHADPLLWNRNLLKRYDYGHVDLPRLVEGHVALQVFGVVTKIPEATSMERNSADSDQITKLALVQAWPPRTWGSLLERALYQAAKLERFVTRSQGRLMLVRCSRDLDRLLARRQAGEAVVGALLSLEGVHALQGDLANLDLLYDAGFRMIGLAHFFDNEAAGSAHGVEKGGLTSFGRELVRRVQERHMALDLAHASSQAIEDVLEGWSGPLIVSHTGLCGTCPGPRNLSDDHVRRIAETGGVLGIAMFEETVGDTTVEDTARAIRYGADLVGADHLAVGADMDGAVTTPIDVSGMALLTEALAAQGFADGEIAQIMGGNALRVLRAVLPLEG
jgi:membrane dipeptidase